MINSITVQYRSEVFEKCYEHNETRSFGSLRLDGRINEPNGYCWLKTIIFNLHVSYIMCGLEIRRKQRNTIGSFHRKFSQMYLHYF